MAPAPPRHRSPRRQGLSLGAYNIFYGWGFGLDQAIQAFHLVRFDAMLLTNTKITSESYFHNRLGYDMVCFPAVTTDTIRAQGVVGLVFIERPQGWGVESMRFHRPNVVSLEVISSGKRTPLIREYLPPTPLEYLPYL